MKKIIYLMYCILTVIATGCNFLDVVPDDTATLADAFKNEDTAEGFLFTCYSYQFDYRNFRTVPGRATTDEIVAESRWGAQWFPFKQYNENVVGSSFSMGTGLYDWRDIWLDGYQAIRQCYIFLENIDGVVPVNTPSNVYEGLKKQWKGEALFLVAYYHHLIFQNYGPLVLLEGTDNSPHPRSKVDDCVNKIVEWYDQAIDMLPANTGAADYGRVNAMIAKAMKAKLLLYAASPIFNGDPENVFNNADPRFVELINKQRDNTKWERALTAINEAITFAEGQGKRLYEYTGTDPVTKQAVASPERQAYLNVRNLLIDSWNSEIIWGSGGGSNTGGTQRIDGDEWERHVAPKGLGTRRNSEGNPVGGLSPSLAAVKIFYTSNGLPPENDINRGYDWTEAGRMAIPAGEKTCNLHLNREQRFYAAIGYDQGIYEYNGWTEHPLSLKRGKNGDDYYIQGLRVQGDGGSGQLQTAIQNQDRLETGYVLKKTINPKSVATSGTFTPTAFVWPVIRLADLYLQYAEACAEAKGNLDDKAKGYIEKIHRRAGLNGANFYYRNYTGTQLVEAVRRERMIELIFESAWHYDLRRWELAEKWHNGQLWGNLGYSEREGMWGLNILGLDDATFYQEVNKVGSMSTPYKFDKRMYFMPIYYQHININDLLVQNPGY
ncbi:MAG: RagB/SusD family nutrient uptake outer membrane protein [Dysgonamonadaceae bacterium]|nr:RagB/SusD family nutrient uptake outer membrane protein [Dysgonamonadaceae bacterium]